ncbi:MAG TPA: preprotein translocase subunit YajC, partial [Myxococcota bacterium]
PLVVMVVFMYFLMIRPERKKQGDHQTYLSSLKKGDEVVLSSGIIGRIEKVEERVLTIEVADKVRIRVLKMSVSGPAARFLAAPGADKADTKVPAPTVVEKADAEKKAS